MKYINLKKTESCHKKNNDITCSIIEGSDQPAHPDSLKRAVAGHVRLVGTLGFTEH